MKTLTKIASLAALAAMASPAWSQNTYSPNAVGYINLTFYPGDNLIANQLIESPDNTLDSIFASGSGILPGTTFSEWSPAANQLLPWSVFNGTSWSINYSFAANGFGGVLDSPALTPVTLIGTVANWDINPPGTGTYTFVPPAFSPGTYLLAMAAPYSGVGFQQVVGTAPVAGDSVETLDAATQTYTTTTFNGTTWDNGTPSLGVDQAAYFTLVPEPSTLALAGVGLGILLSRQKKISRLLLS